MLLTLASAVQTQQIIHPEARNHFLVIDPEVGLSHLDEYFVRDGNSLDMLMERASLRLLYGEESEAMMDIRALNDLNPYALYLHGFYGSSARFTLYESQPEEALKELSLTRRMQYYSDKFIEHRAEGLLPRDEYVQLVQVVNFISEGALTVARNILDDVIEANPDCAHAHDLKGLLYTEAGEYDLALEELSTAIALQPGYAMAWYNMGRLERKQGRDNHAIDYFNAAIDIQADLYKAYFDRALAYKSIDDLQGAISDYDIILSAPSELDRYVRANRGLTLKMAGYFEPALEDVSAAIDHFPDSAALYKNRGNLNMLLSQYPEAIDDYDRALIIDPRYHEARYNRGLTHYILGESVLACRDLEWAANAGLERAMEKLEMFCEAD